MAKYVALLRGINVTGRHKVAMSDLRQVATNLGFTNVTTYIQSGNLIFSSKGTASELEVHLEEALGSQFGFAIPVIIRSKPQWLAYAKSTPFPDAQQLRPQVLLLAVCKMSIPRGAVELLMARASLGERVAQGKEALWIDFLGGSGRSKLNPSVLDRVCGGPVTTRNWRTVQAIAQLLTEVSVPSKV
jgi:uncharacterized protein (DUF1697 family)